MKLKDVLEKTTQFFREKSFSSPRLDAELLLSHALGVERIRLYLDFDRPLTTEELEACRGLVRRRVAGEPVAYILGSRGFYGLDFKVNSSVLIPRPETEHLVEQALVWLQAQDSDKQVLMVDLGCGSGCLGLSVLANWPQAQLIAMDLSAEALDVARANAEALRLTERCHFIQGDAADPETRNRALAAIQKSEVHLLLANPPYIREDDPLVEKGVRDFEPATALFAPEQGLAYLRSWSKNWSPVLACPSLCLMEIGHEQGPDVEEHFQGLGVFQQTNLIQDLSQRDRVIKGVRHG